MIAQTVTRFLRDDSGGTHLEYAILAMFGAGGVLAGLTAMSESLQAMFLALAGYLDGVLGA